MNNLTLVESASSQHGKKEGAGTPGFLGGLPRTRKTLIRAADKIRRSSVADRPPRDDPWIKTSGRGSRGGGGENRDRGRRQEADKGRGVLVLRVVKRGDKGNRRAKREQ